ncbi:MAG: hypothetical protein ACHP6H_02235 [Legionellales bacterium]
MEWFYNLPFVLQVIGFLVVVVGGGLFFAIILHRPGVVVIVAVAFMVVCAIIATKDMNAEHSFSASMPACVVYNDKVYDVVTFDKTSNKVTIKRHGGDKTIIVRTSSVQRVASF